MLMEFTMFYKPITIFIYILALYIYIYIYIYIIKYRVCMYIYIYIHIHTHTHTHTHTQTKCDQKVSTFKFSIQNLNEDSCAAAKDVKKWLSQDLILTCQS